MRAVVQRVKNAKVSISDQIVGKCEIGALILVQQFVADVRSLG